MDICTFIMQRVSMNGVQMWQFEHFRKQPGVKHFVSDRESAPSPIEFTLSLSSSPDKLSIEENRKQVAKAMGIERSRFFMPSQIHKTKIVNVTSDLDRALLADTDAVVSTEPGVCIAVMSADCVPVLLYDIEKRVVAAIHAGWKGTVARIVEKTLNYLAEHFGSEGKNIMAGIGPSVSQDSYEVGLEVIEAVHQSFSKPESLLIPQPNNKAKLDLWNANKIQLLEFGVKDSMIEVSNLCTVKNNQYFFSARRGDTGRFAAGIMLYD